MALCDGLPHLSKSINLPTDTATTDVATLNLPSDSSYLLHVIAHDASGDNSLATLGIFTAASGGGTAIVADAALTTHTTSAIKSARTIAVPAVASETLYVRVGTASGVAGSKISLTIIGVAL